MYQTETIVIKGRKWTIRQTPLRIRHGREDASSLIDPHDRDILIGTGCDPEDVFKRVIIAIKRATKLSAKRWKKRPAKSQTK